MKKRNVIFFYVAFAFALAVSAALIGLGIYGFVKGDIASGSVLFIFAAGFLLALGAMFAREYLNDKCTELFCQKKFDEERAYLERVRKSPFSFVTHTVAMVHYVTVCMALDDLSAASPVIARLRHGGGAGWKYKTAYFYILIKLDEGDLETAHTEFEEFRRECAQAKIYHDQIEVLTAIFHRLYRTENNEPLPASAVNSNYPVVSRILGKHYEARAAASGEEWGE